MTKNSVGINESKIVNCRQTNEEKKKDVWIHVFCPWQKDLSSKEKNNREKDRDRMLIKVFPQCKTSTWL